MATRIPEPAVSRKVLVRSAAITWSGVGTFLSLRAMIWFRLSTSNVFWMVLLALTIGLLKGHYVFRKLARRNIMRIKTLSPHKEKICLFAFQAIQSYLLIIGMIGLGILLRLSPIQREYLAVIYLAIGFALIYASIPYWKEDFSS
jgi:hypothetical protein